LLLNHDSSIQALSQSKNEKIIRTISWNNGTTSESLEATVLPNKNSGIEALTLDDDRHLLLYKHVSDTWSLTRKD
jgi:predicted neuraminidase